MRDYLEFEQPLRELEERIEKLSKSDASRRDSSRQELRKLKAKLVQMESEIYGNLSPWQRTQIARHPRRPGLLEYLDACCVDFLELHGDRMYGDDPAVIGGFARLSGHPIMVIGTYKGRTLKERMHRNFGMPHPEGYRKACRLMVLAEKFRLPVVTLIDTPGAYPGVGAEERGQAQAIARNLFVMARLKVPMVAVIVGEGGSGGALALGAADRVVMFEHAIYSVISPEGCAAIVWEDPSKAPVAAAALKLTAQDLRVQKIVDDIIPEPLGGAHRDPQAAAASLAKVLDGHLAHLQEVSIDDLIAKRGQKFNEPPPSGQFASAAG